MPTIGENTQEIDSAVNTSSGSLTSSGSSISSGSQSKEVWLCLRFTHLALNSFGFAFSHEKPIAITEHQQIWQHNQLVAESSIENGMSISHALMLKANIDLRQRDPKTESIKLQELSHWAYRFTSLVSIYNDHTLLLEVGKSINLFNNLEHLLNLVKHDLSSFQIETKFGLAATPKAAYVVSFSRQTQLVQSAPKTLNYAAIEHLDIDSRIIRKLHHCGFKTLKCIQAIPNAELGSRFGKEFVYYLEQLWGHLADPQIAALPPETFHASVDFSEPIRNLAWIQQQLERLLGDLTEFIKLRQLVCRSFTWRFYRENNKLLKTVTIGLSAKQNTQSVFQELTQLKLAETQLDWEFSCIELTSVQLVPIQLFNDDLFEPQENQQQFNQLVDKLISRLGHTALFRVHPEPEQLPELANGRKHAITEGVKEKQTNYGTRCSIEPFKDEPLWLLEQPKRLAQQEQQPIFEGPLTIIHGPNRISSHWWAKLQSRDYFIVRQRSGRLLWVFFERGKRSWYLHGLFA